MRLAQQVFHVADRDAEVQVLTSEHDGGRYPDDLALSLKMGPPDEPGAMGAEICSTVMSASTLRIALTRPFEIGVFEPERVPDGDDSVARADRAAVAQRQDGELLRLNAQDDQIALAVAVPNSTTETRADRSRSP